MRAYNITHNLFAVAIHDIKHKVTRVVFIDGLDLVPLYLLFFLCSLIFKMFGNVEFS